MRNFQRPNSGWLCLFSLLWVAVGFGFGVKFGVAGNWTGAGLMLLFGLAGIGLWSLVIALTSLVAAFDEITVVARAARESIASKPAVQDIRAAQALDAVVCAVAYQRVGECVAGGVDARGA